MTTHVSPAAGKEEADYFHRYLIAKGALEHLAELVHTATESFADDRLRLRAFYAGLLGLLDQAWKLEGINGRLAEGCLIERLIDYGRVCCAEDDGKVSNMTEASTKRTRHDAAVELVQRLDKLEAPSGDLASIVAQHAPRVAELLAVDQEHGRWEDEDA